MAEWQTHFTSVCLSRVGARFRFQSCVSSRCGHESQARKFYCKFFQFKLKLRLAHTPDNFAFFMVLEFIQINQVWVHYFKSFIREKSTQDKNVRFIKGNELKLTQVELLSFFFFSESTYCLLFFSLILIFCPNLFHAQTKRPASKFSTKVLERVFEKTSKRLFQKSLKIIYRDTSKS